MDEFLEKKWNIQGTTLGAALGKGTGVTPWKTPEKSFVESSDLFFEELEEKLLVKFSEKFLE